MTSFKSSKVRLVGLMDVVNKILGCLNTYFLGSFEIALELVKFFFIDELFIIRVDKSFIYDAFVVGGLRFLLRNIILFFELLTLFTILLFFLFHLIGFDHLQLKSFGLASYLADVQVFIGFLDWFG